MVQFWSLHTHYRCIGSGQESGQHGHSAGLWTHCCMSSKLRCVLCSTWHLSIMDIFSNLDAYDPVPGSLLLFHGSILDTNHFLPGTPTKICYFGDPLAQSSRHHNLVLIYVTQIHARAHSISCFHRINFEYCCLTSPTPLQDPLQQYNQCYSLCLFKWFYCYGWLVYMVWECPIINGQKVHL